MVHGLRTLDRLNGDAARSGRLDKRNGKKVEVPGGLALNPHEARKYVNCPWDGKELTEPIRFGKKEKNELRETQKNDKAGDRL
jgi:hypothetical protein